MVQIKIFVKDNSKSLERDVNEFLVNIGSEPGNIVDLKDIKINYSPSSLIVATVIYSIQKIKKSDD